MRAHLRTEAASAPELHGGERLLWDPQVKQRALARANGKRFTRAAAHSVCEKNRRSA